MVLRFRLSGRNPSQETHEQAANYVAQRVGLPKQLQSLCSTSLIAILAAFVFAVAWIPSHAGLLDRIGGLVPNGTYDGDANLATKGQLGDFDGENIDVMTGNLNLIFPVGPRYQLNDWFGYQLNLVYNSRVWYHDCDIGSIDCPGELVSGPSYGEGFEMHFGKIYRRDTDLAGVYRYRNPTGGEHFFCDPFAQGASQDCQDLQGFTPGPETIWFQSVNEDTWLAYPGDGTRLTFADTGTPDVWYVTEIETIADDGAANPKPQHRIAIQMVEDRITFVRDYTNINGVETLNRTVQIRDHLSSSVKIDFPVFNGIATWTLRRAPMTICDPTDVWGTLGTDCGNPNTDVNSFVLEAIELPELDNSTNQPYSYEFTDYTAHGLLHEWNDRQVQ